MSKKEINTKDLSHVDIPMLKQYATTYLNTTDTTVADKAVDVFLKNYKVWKEVVGYVPNGEDVRQVVITLRRLRRC